MDDVKFWSRVGRWFRNTDRASDGDQPGVWEGPNDDSPANDEPSSARALLAQTDTISDIKIHPGTPPTGMDKLAEEYARVVKLMDGIEQHMAAQDERSDHLVRALDRVVETLTDASTTSHQQLEVLSAIRESTTAGEAGRKRLEEELAQLPRLADAQRETMVSIGRQLDAAQSTDEKIAASMVEVNESVAGLAKVTEASRDTVAHLRTDAALREEHLASMLHEQGKRLTIVAWSAISLAGVVTIVFLVDLIRG